jgi:peptidoglycan/xylan/chitin deacetylase (PgdA/CDA1 family)
MLAAGGLATTWRNRRGHEQPHFCQPEPIKVTAAKKELVMRAAIVGGIIAIISLAAYGIVQAGWWPRGGPGQQAAIVETAQPQPAEVQAADVQPEQVQVAQVVASVPVVPLDEVTPAPMPGAPAEAASSSIVAIAETPAGPAGGATETSANPVVAPAEVAANPVVAPVAVAPAPVAPAPVAPAAVKANPAVVPVAAPAVAPAAPAVRPTIVPVVAPAAPAAPAAPPIVVAQLAPAPIAPTIRPAGSPAPVAAPAAAPVAAPAPAAPPAAAAPAPPAIKAPAIACANPSAMGVSRVVEIDTTGGPGFGSQHFKSLDFLRDHEVVLTFDDGPWLNTTPAVLKALADQCLRATFFNIGKHATYYPEILKQVLAAGHTVGSHTWSHADLSKKTPDEAKEEIEKGISAVHFYGGAQIAPFFRFPDLRHPPEMLTYLGQRNIASFSTDIDSFDFKIKKPDQLIKSLMGKLNKQGKGIILMHDFQKGTAAALPELLGQLKANGFKVVHMVPKDQVTTLPQFDEAVIKDQKLPTVSQRPTESVVRTISEKP